MFEKISNAAEKLATNVSESRRGFLARVGQAALGVAGVVGGLLALPAEAQAITGKYCEVYVSGFNPIQFRLTGSCLSADSCQYGGGYCRRGQPAGGIRWVCRYSHRVSVGYPC